MRWGIAVAIVLVSNLAGCYTEPYAQHARIPIERADTVGVMTNHDIIAMSKAGIPDSVIINLMDVSETGFRLRPSDVIALTDSGVTGRVVHAMISRAGSPRAENGGAGTTFYPARGWCWYYPYYGGWYPWYPALYFVLSGYYDSGYARAYFAPGPRFFFHRDWYRFPHLRPSVGGRSWGVRRH